MTFRDLDEFLEVEPLELPIRGKVYTFPGEISGRSWLLVQRLVAQLEQTRRDQKDGVESDVDAQLITDLDEAALKVEMFGGIDVEMADDGLTSAQINHVFPTLLTFHMYGRETAEAVWNGQGEARAPNREARRSAAKSTPSRGSRAGSSLPKRNGTASPGRASSSTGR